jgi:hypothetical protein
LPIVKTDVSAAGSGSGERDAAQLIRGAAVEVKGRFSPDRLWERCEYRVAILGPPVELIATPFVTSSE